MHSGMGYGRPEPDVEGDRTLEYVLAFNLLPGRVIPKTLKLVLAALLLGAQH